MMTVLLFLVAGTFLTFVSRSNLMPVTLKVGPYIFANIPLFYVIVGSLVAGILLSYLLQLIPSISTFFTLRGKEKEIKQKKGDVLELTKRVHQLELENERLKHTDIQVPQDENAL